MVVTNFKEAKMVSRQKKIKDVNFRNGKYNHLPTENIVSNKLGINCDKCVYFCEGNDDYRSSCQHIKNKRNNDFEVEYLDLCNDFHYFAYHCFNCKHSEINKPFVEDEKEIKKHPNQVFRDKLRYKVMTCDNPESPYFGFPIDFDLICQCF